MSGATRGRRMRNLKRQKWNEVWEIWKKQSKYQEQSKILV